MQTCLKWVFPVWLLLPFRQHNLKGFLRQSLFLTALLFFTYPAQKCQADSVQVLSLAALYENIQANHPVAKQAALLPEQARQEIRLARGNFDPELSSYYGQKKYNETRYYQNWNTLVQVPLWFGADLRGGFEQNTGAYVNPESRTPSAGLTYAGISLPLGQGWLIDRRRATLRQAQALATAAEAEKVKEINKLLLQATKEYYYWALAYQRLQLLQSAFELAQVRYQGVAERARFGDLAAIDTLEALLEVNNRQQLLLQAETDFQNGRLLVSNYLWESGQTPVELKSNTVPAALAVTGPVITEAELNRLLEAAHQNHPELIKLQAKQRQLEFERRLAADKFKPKLTVEYNFLRSGFGSPAEDAGVNFLENNYKAGFSFSYPLFLRHERGKLQQTKLKILDTDLALLQTRRDIETSLKTTFTEIRQLEKQVRAQEQLVAQAEILRNSEQIRFQNGESSLFLVNSREMGLVNQTLKLWELKTKYAQSRVYLNWSAGSMQDLN